MPKLSVIIITKNEALNIVDALESVSWADEIIVVDSGSTDETVSLARRYTNHVNFHEWQGYGSQKNYAASLAKNDWILSLDADERVSSKLSTEIRELLTKTPSHNGYQIPRIVYYLGRWIRSTDWYPDYQLRLYDRRVATWNANSVHESVNLKGSVDKLQNELLHYSYKNISDHIVTINRYTTLAARQMYTREQHASLLDLVLRPLFTFLRNYAFRLGIREGIPGIIVSLMNSYYVFLKFSKLWELQRREPNQ